MDDKPFQPSLLDVPISFFEYDHQRNTFANVPSQQTTLRRITKTSFYRPIIELIRSESDKDKQDTLKKQLPAITPVTLLYHRKRDTTFTQKVRYQWPVLMGDVDKKDNPSLDMAELKKHLSRLPYLLLCAYSVRGGLWFVVRVPDGQTPETLAAHFRYLQKLFSQKFGIVLDNTKGGNPTDLRFVSYDAAPFFNEQATVMSGAYTPPKPTPKTHRPFRQVDFKRPDEELLNRLLRFVQGAAEGQRHERLLKAATVAGGYIATGRMEEQTAIYGLETVASEWPTFSKSQKTIRDGIRYGLTAPIYPEAPSDYTTKVLTANGPIRGLAVSSNIQQPTQSEYQAEILTPPDHISQHDAQPIIEPISFFEWQRQNPAFSQLGLASLASHPNREDRNL